MERSDSEYESGSSPTKKKLRTEIVHKKCVTTDSSQDLKSSETQSTDNESRRLNKAPKTSAERGREFRARKALLKQQCKQQQESDAIVEIATEDIRSAGPSEKNQVPEPSEIKTIEKRAKSAEATRRWREKKKGVSESPKKQAKTAAQRMREYRERMMSTNMKACDGTEKVKRRMIRTIGRLLQEQKPQDEIWEYMEKEYGMKCKVLWDRMRVLTLKKLKCLFNAQDVVNNVPKMARMTLTDWLIFDLVLVHEKFDVIDMNGIRNNKPSKVLYNLFSLVLRFEIEGRTGEQLADAWIAATVHYNSLGHQCSPMLLQRRWYQLKELTRATFYKFWFIFRGNKRQLDRAKEDSPISELQRDIALRYSKLITQPFVEWEECIKNRTVIMPDEFETKMRNVTLMKPTDLTVPDLVLVEPKISTIDLCDDSDIEELNEDITKEKDTQTPKAIELSPVMIKSEPIDLEEDDLQDAQNSDAQVEENDDFDQEIQRLQLVENEIIIDLDGEGTSEDRESETNTPDGNEESARESTDSRDEEFGQEVTDGGAEIRRESTGENETQPTTEENTDDILVNAATESQINNIMEVENTSDVNQEQSAQIIDDAVRSIESESALANLPIKSENIEETNTENYVENVDQNNETDLVVKVEKDTLIDEANPESTFPIIATVSSAGVPVSMDTAIEGHSNDVPMDTDDVTEIEEENFRDNYIIGQSEDSNKVDNLKRTEDKEDSSSEEDIIKLASPVINKDVGQYSECVPLDLEFADDGIQLVDDGIEYVESDEDNNTKTEDEQPKIDLKLLMVPVVYTTKLDNMIVFKQRLLLDGVNQKEILEKILAESKPISKLAIKEEPKETRKIEVPKQYEERTLNKPVVDLNNDTLEIKEEPQDIEDTALDSSEDEVEVPRVKLTSYLLRKPRRRSYNPIQLCKNPDFNTRLKRLPVSFFTSQRNRFLLNECKPMTIDVCKAFESKLFNGTLYLTNSGNSNFSSPVKVNNADTMPTVSVIAPSATPVQSLMDIDKLLENELKKRMGERNKTINLPDITEVRRINQHLLTAEVTPLRISPTDSPVNKDVSIVIEDDPAVSRQDVVEKAANEEAVLPVVSPKPTIAPSIPTPSLPVIARPKPEVSTNPEVLDSNNPQNTMSLNKIRKQNRKTIHPQISWRSTKKIRAPIDNSDLLLTTDTLYKMLFAIDPSGVKSSSYNKYVRDNLKNKVVLQNKTIYYPKGLSHKKADDEPIEIKDDANEKLQDKGKDMVEDKGEDIVEDNGNKNLGDHQENQPAKAKVKVVYDKSKFVKRKRYCCWASARMDLLNGNTTRCRPHKCREICSCCCKLELADMIFTNESNANESKSAKESVENEDDRIKNACESIESVVQQTRELAQSKPLVPAAAILNTTKLNVTEAIASTQVDLTTNDDTPMNNTQVTVIYKRNTAPKLPPREPNTTKLNVTEAIASTQVDLTTNDDTPTKNTQGSVIYKRNTASKLPPREPTLLEKLAEAQAQAKILKRPPTLAKPFKQLAQPDITQWTLCPCKRPVLKLNGQRTIVVDGTNTCQYHFKNKDSKQGQLYINRKGQGNERPIFIGKNKLLLTNVKKPDATLAAPPVSPSLASVPAAENLQMPEGVQIILLPNGTLTYSVDSGVNMSAEQLSVMPAILASIQVQINSGCLTVIDPKAVEPKEQIKESSDIIGFKEGEQGPVPVDTVPVPPLLFRSETTPSVPVETIDLDKVLSNNSVSPINTENTPETADQATLIERNKTENALISPSKETNEDVSTSLKSNDAFTDINEENDDEENKLVIDENINKDINTHQKSEAMPAEVIQNSETTESETATKKNRASLLSDLMEMSGICEEDIAPTAAPVSQVALSVDTQETSLERSILTRCSPRRIIPVPSLSPISQSPKKSDIKDIYSNLSTVNSFAELKYAYNNNGLFFKLDLDSGVIVPITLCIKKKQTAKEPSKPGTVIDLTDDFDNEDEKITFNTTEKNPTESDNILTSTVFKRVLSEVKTAEQSLKLKRLKPNILQRAHQLTLNQKSLLKTCPRPRKIYPNRVEAQIDLVDSDNPMEEEYLQSSNDDTSDDEPLAKKARRTAEQRQNTTPVDFEEDKDSMSDMIDNNRESTEATQVDNRMDSESVQETETEDLQSDSEIIPASALDAPAVQPSSVTLDDPKPTHLVLTRHDHHETVPIDSYYNDDGDDEDSQDCILGV